MKEDITVTRQREILANNIQRLLDSRGINQTIMARDLNLAETTVSSWMKAKRYPGLKNQQLMADYFNVKRSELTDEKPSNVYPVSPQTVKVPILGIIACGDPITAEENVKGYRYESPDSLPRGNTFYLEASGDSMEPTIPNGSIVLFREQNDVENGEIAAVLLEGDTEATLKRIKKQGDVVMLMPDNNKHDPIIISEENPARIIGKAIQYTRVL